MVFAVPLFLSTYSAADTLQCGWYPLTCQNGAATSPVEPSCLKDAICDERGKEYTSANWPTSGEELEKVCARYVQQHGYGQDSICGE
jgi:hypothetical protein